MHISKYYDNNLYIAVAELTTPSSQTVLAGHDAQFFCCLVMVTWTFRGHHLPFNAIDVGNGILSIKQSTTHNEGSYTCNGRLVDTNFSSDGLLRVRS